VKSRSPKRWSMRTAAGSSFSSWVLGPRLLLPRIFQRSGVSSTGSRRTASYNAQAVDLALIGFWIGSGTMALDLALIGFWIGSGTMALDLALIGFWIGSGTMALMCNFGSAR